MKKIINSNGDDITCMTLSPKNILSFGTKLGKIKSYHLNKDFLENYHWHPVQVNHLKFSNDGNYLYSGGNSGILLCNGVYDKNSTKRLCFVKEEIKSFNVNKIQNRYVIITSSNVMMIVDPSKFRYHSGVSGISHEISGVNISHTDESDDQKDENGMICEPINNNILFVGNENNKIQWYDYEKDIEVHKEVIFFQANSFDPHSSNIAKPRKVKITNIQFSKDGKYFVHVEVFKKTERFEKDQNNIKVWKISEKGLMNKYKIMSVFDNPHQDFINCVKFNPEVNEVCFATSSLDKRVKIWRKKDQIFHCYAIFQFKDMIPCCFDFSLDGSLLLICYEGFITFWDMKKYSMLFSLKISDSNISNVLCISKEFIVVQENKEKKRILFYSFEKMKIVSSLEFEHEILCIKKNQFKENEFVVAFSNVKCILLMNILEKEGKNVIKKIITEGFVKSLVFTKSETIVYFTKDFELFKVEITLIGKETSIVDPMNIDTDEGLELQLSLKKKKKKEEMEDITIHEIVKFDFNRGLNSWKYLFDVSSHSLSNMSSIYESFMDCFILKREKE